MAELPSMDDILRESTRAEAAKQRRLGLFLVIVGVGVAAAMFAVTATTSRAFYVFPAGTVSYGVACLGRGLRGQT